jgi:hypothetical protein
MDNFNQTSFIPQQPILKVEGFARRREQVNYALVIALALFFIALMVAGGIYFYQLQVDGRVKARTNELATLEKSLSASDISHYKDVQNRLLTAKQLIKSHSVFSNVLDLVEQSTISDVGLTGLSYGNSKGGVSISLEGQAPSYERVYFQEQVWKAMKPTIMNAEVSGVNLSDSTGIVNFKAVLTIDPAFVRYDHILKQQGKKEDLTGAIKLPPL